MKKILLAIILLLLIVALTVCSISVSSMRTQDSSSQNIEISEEPKLVSSGLNITNGQGRVNSSPDKGEGTIYITTESGTSENGNIPVVYVTDDISLVQIELTAIDCNGDNLSCIAVDGAKTTNDYMEKVKLSNNQISLTLEGSRLAIGTHIVEIVQFEEDNPMAIKGYKKMYYEVKTK